MFKIKLILIGIFVSYVSVLAQKLIAKEIRKGLEISIPDKFVMMNDDDLAQKYPSYRKPLAVFTNENKTADIGINYSINKWNNKNLTILKDMYKATISSVFTEVEFIQDGIVKNINGRDFIIFEFISTLVEENGPKKGATVRTYSYIGYSLYEKKVLVFNLNAPAQEKNNWNLVFGSVFESIKVNNKLELDAFIPYEAENKPQPKGGADDPQLRLLKKMRKPRAKNPQ